MSDKIFVVDDSVDNRRLLKKALEKDNYEIIEAENGLDALNLAIKILPDLILLDIVMPEMDGFQTCQALKANPQTKHIPVIFLSAKSETQDKIRGLEMGGADYITKPFDRGEVLARVRTQLKILHLMKELLLKQKNLDEDLQAAAAIQQTLLPQKKKEVEGINIAWKFVPCDRIGGDIFNVVQLDENHLAFYIVDVSGHGVPGAMVTVSVSQVLQPHSGYLKRKLEHFPFYEIVSPVAVLRKLDEEYPLERFNKYFTIFYLVLDIRQGRIIYSNAAHPPPVLLRQNGELELLEQGGTIIGMDGIIPFEEEEKYLLPGDKIIFYTDGVTEYLNPERNFWGTERFYDALTKVKQEPVGSILDYIYHALQDFGQHARVEDDISLLGLEFIAAQKV